MNSWDLFVFIPKAALNAVFACFCRFVVRYNKCIFKAVFYSNRPLALNKSYSTAIEFCKRKSGLRWKAEILIKERTLGTRPNPVVAEAGASLCFQITANGSRLLESSGQKRLVSTRTKSSGSIKELPVTARRSKFPRLVSPRVAQAAAHYFVVTRWS